MNTHDLQQLKLAWLAAQEAGDAHVQHQLLLDHPQQQQELIDFIATYYASGGVTLDIQDEQSSALTVMAQRATQAALVRVFAAQTVTELRKSRNLSKREASQGLRLAMNIWDKFESGTIRATSLSRAQLQRLAQFFQVSMQQFATALENSGPVAAAYRRQTIQGASTPGPQVGSEDFAEVIEHSTMTREDKQFWLKM